MLFKLLNRFKNLLYLIWGILRRAICWRTRSRKNSGMLLPVTNPATAVANRQTESVYSNPNFVAPSKYTGFGSHDYHQNLQAAAVATAQQDQFSASSSTNVLSHQHDRHSTNQASHSTAQPVEPEPDLFADLAPKITKQRKILISKSQEPIHTTQVGSQRDNKKSIFTYDQKASIDLSQPFNNQLGEIDDHPDHMRGWTNESHVSLVNGVDNWDVDDIGVDPEQTIAQARSTERERRLAEHRRLKEQKMLQQRHHKSTLLAATKLS